MSASSAWADQCTTSSRGLNFSSYNSDINSASSEAVGQCQSNPYTSNDECRQNLRCDHNSYNPYPGNPSYPGDRVSCTSSSRGLTFRGEGYNADQASRDAVSQCQANPYTSNEECRQTLSCSNGGYNPPPSYPPTYPNPPSSGSVSCSTQSRGRYFNRQGWDYNQVSNDVVRECIGDRYTDSNECRRNLQCNNDGYNPYPPTQPTPPTYPGPQSWACEARTNWGQYTGFGSSRESAAADARSQCILRENNSRVCNSAQMNCYPTNSGGFNGGIILR